MPLACSPRQQVIERIELYLVNIEKERHFSHGAWNTRQHAMIRISTPAVSGWAELRIAKNNPDIDIREWGGFSRDLVGLTVQDAFAFLVQNRGPDPWSRRVVEAFDMALWDIQGRLSNKPSIELLGLESSSSVPGLFCILEKDKDRVRQQTQTTIEQGLTSHIKLKIFGDAAKDAELVSIVRDVAGPSTFIIADPNRGYDQWQSLDELAESLRVLHDNGLNACEDPAALSVPQWVELQSKVDDLILIPDKPLRPAWESIDTVQPGMGKIYNLHPGTMGNLTGMVELIHKIRSWGAKVMIGDDSLVGAACTAWQQIAIGAGAVCVEAIEKPQEDQTFLDCIISKATYKNENGQFVMERRPGFGLEVNASKLQKTADDYFETHS